MGIKQYECDVLIVGGGLSGLQAAITVGSDAPQKKVVLADLGGGASSEVMGFCAPMSPEDSPECFVKDTLAAGAGENCPELVGRLCNDASGVVKKLEAIGIEFDKKPDGSYDMLRSLGSTYHRVVHYKTLTGITAMGKYRETLKQRGVEIKKARIVKLFETDGAVAGALGFEDGQPVFFKTPCVVLATGGAAGLFGFSTWTKMLQGSGYAMAADLGAQLTSLKRVQFEPCVTVYPEKFRSFPIITTMLFEGAKLIDAKGRSVLKEGEQIPSKRGLAEMIAAAVADGGDCGHGGVWFDFSGVDEELFKRKYPEYYRKLRPLAADYKDLRVEVKPAAHTTLGGIKINRNAETSVRGLLAAGEASGGIHGRDRIGGNAGLEIFVFGNAAGETAAKFDAKAADALPQCQAALDSVKSGTADAKDYLQKLGKILDDNAGVYRTAQDSQNCKGAIAALEAQFVANPPKDSEEYFVCKNAFTTAKMLAQF